MMIQTMLIFPDGEVRLENVDNVYPAINRALGVQWIEGIYTPGLAYYLDEEGKFNGHEPNPLAEELYRANGGQLFPGDFLVGPVAVVGMDYESGEDKPLPQSVIDWMDQERPDWR